jgi:hypothetical protein
MLISKSVFSGQEKFSHYFGFGKEIGFRYYQELKVSSSHGDTEAQGKKL